MQYKSETSVNDYAMETVFRTAEVIGVPKVLMCIQG